jgi:hypothetical protein
MRLRFARPDCRSLGPVLLLLALAGELAPLRALPPGFTAGWSALRGSSTFAVALGDVDGDGDIDAYTSEWYVPHRLWLNDGDGQFTLSPQAMGNGYGSCAQLAPLDSGSSLDLWVTRHLGSNRVFTNNGTGTFTDSGQALGGSVSRHGCALGDLDGDLDLDAFVATNDPGASNEIYFNNGVGIFSASAQSLGLYSTRAVALGDVDGDLDLDVLFGNNGANKLWKNNGSGIFTDSGATIGTRGTFDAALADLDGDLDLDAFFANGSTSGDPEEVWFNNGAGVFSNSGQSFGDDYSFSLALLDADGDDDLDAFVGNNDGLPNRLYWNDGDGHFADSAQAVGIGGTIDVASADLDGDLDLDLFLANAGQPEQVLLNDGAGLFSSNGQILGSNSAESVALGDLDGDGDRDAVLGSYGGLLRIFRNDGGGAFSDDDQWISPGYGPSSIALALADFDDDGDLDIWAGLCCVGSGFTDDPADRLFSNDGTGHFSDSGQLFGSDYTTGVAVGDYDGDGDPDVAVSNYQSVFSNGASRVYRNNGAGVFTQGPQALGSGTHSAIATADLDNDSDLDLVFAKRTGGSQVYRNVNGTGAFNATAQTLGTADAVALALGRLDGDADVDIFLGTVAGSQVWLNNGNATFTDSGQALGTGWISAVHLIDVDLDSDLDAWATGDGGLGCEPNKVWINDGTGQFTDSGWNVGCGGSGQSAAADLDRNLSLDIFLASFDGDHAVWLNQLSHLIFADDFESGNTTSWSVSVP